MCFWNKIQKWSSEDRQYSGHKTEGQTIQWPQEKGQMYKQWSTKHYTENTDRTIWTPIKPGVNSGASEWQAVPAPYNNKKIYK